MATYDNLLVEIGEGICQITLNRPKALNALNAATLKDLDAALDQIVGDPAVGVVIVTGAGDKAFVAGADISEMQPMSSLEGREWGRWGQAVFAKVESLPQPVIAAVNGFALGGGCELAMACDIRLASEKAKFGQPEVQLGITAGFCGTQRLSRLIGRGRAKEMLFTGDMIDAAEAYRIGLVNRVTAPEELLTAARTLARKILDKGPVAVRLTKAAVNAGVDLPLKEAAAYEAEVFGLCFSTADQKEGMSAFLEKRTPNFSGK
ncbi:MAG TPA: enoyl-CoA hydratase-related protein [Patescibacteria group bacterium]|nr:enoyl-CoA hydratase-related protein [Patescibacteria group bacterium]